MIEVGHTYRHYKGGLYKILAVGLHSDTEKKMIVYQNINEDVVYNDIDNPDKIWVREESVFTGTVEIDNQTIKRFELVD
jgi:hypothetical protein